MLELLFHSDIARRFGLIPSESRPEISHEAHPNHETKDSAETCPGTTNFGNESRERFGLNDFFSHGKFELVRIYLGLILNVVLHSKLRLIVVGVSVVNELAILVLLVDPMEGKDKILIITKEVEN